eukprot:403368929
MYKNEAISYQGAYLTSCRQALLPYLQRGVQCLPDEDQETEIMKKLYEADLIEEYESIWDTEKEQLLKQLKYRVGHVLRIKDSSIDHHEAGRGVFLECPRRQPIVLPGTLLGIFPGVVCDPGCPMPPTPKRGLRPYLKRFDGYWIDYEKELPYPMPSPGSNLIDFAENFSSQIDKSGMHKSFIEVPPEYMNPFALGHLINHPPPDIPANVQLIDFDLPYTFFPSTVAVVAQQTISSGEELFCDYLTDERVSIEYLPDWLLEPPPSPNSVYLTKKEITANVPFTVKLLYSYQRAMGGKQIQEFEARTKHDQITDSQELKVKKLIQEKLNFGGPLLGSGNKKDAGQISSGSDEKPKQIGDSDNKDK